MAVAPSPDTLVAAAAASPGSGILRVSRVGRRSVVTRARACSPLKLLTPANHGHAAWIFTSTYGGGLVGGDAIALDIEIDGRAAALISTQASTKVYRSARGTSSRLDARVGAGGLLVSMPDPVVCFASSKYQQHQTFELEGDASLVALDWMSSGRRESGERWAFDEYRTRTTVRLGEALVCHDALTLSSADSSLAERMGRFDVFATIVLAGRRVRGASARIIDRVSAQPLARRSGLIVTAAPLAAGAGAIIRIAGPSVQDVGRAIHESLSFVPALLGDNPHTRKW